MSSLRFSIPLILIFLASIAEMQNSVPIRKGITSFSDDGKQSLLGALYKMKASPSKYNASFSSYDYYVYIHTTQSTLYRSSWRFLPWHRQFLFHFEQELQSFLNDSSFRLPYWDMTDEVSTEQTLFDEEFIGGNGQESRGWLLPDSCQLSCDKWGIDLRLTKDTEFQNVSCLSRQIGSNPMIPTLPDKALWDELKGCEYDINSYDFQALDDVIHGFIGGHDSSSASTVDPLFFLLYSWIDALWALYQDHNGIHSGFDFNAFDDDDYWNQSLFEGYFNDDTTMSIAEIMDIRSQLNYAYDLQDESLWMLIPVKEQWWKSNVVMAFMISVVVVGLSGMCCWGIRKLHCKRPAKVRVRPTLMGAASSTMRMGNWSLSSPASSLSSLL